MNTPPFKDKQVMDTPGIGGGSPETESNTKEYIDIMKSPNIEETNNNNNNENEEIVASYDFQPIRPIQSHSLNDSSTAVGTGGSRAWSNSTDSKSNFSSIRNYSTLQTTDPAKFSLGKDANVDYTGILSEIDQTMKKHADNLLNVLEGISARLSQLESRTHHLENSVDDLKVSVGNNQGSSDGKMRQLENILREVQTGVQVLRDKHEILEAQLQLSKIQIPKVDHQSETQNAGETDSLQHASYTPMQQIIFSPQQQHPSFSLSLPSLPPPNAPPPASQLQNSSLQVQAPNQFPQNQNPPIAQRDPYYSPPDQTQEVLTQQYQMPATQQHQMLPNQQHQTPPSQQSQPPPSSAPLQQYQPAPHPQYGQLPQQHPSLPSKPPPQIQPPTSHHPEETPYTPSNYPPSLYPPTQSPRGTLSSQPFFGLPSHVYEPQSVRPSSGFSSGYGPPTGPTEPYLRSSLPQYGGGSAMMKPQPTPSLSQGGGSGYPQLPTARLLPQASPTGSGVGGASGSAGTGNRVPIDDVVDRVTNMGFPRDHVRATVRRLTENGESVDLNIVLDKLMNDTEVQPPKGWFGR